MDFESERARMVTETVARRGVRDTNVLNAMREVPRHLFLPENLREFAYRDSPLPIGENQTISQPFIVALMAEAALLTPNDRVLEVGTGSAYGAAILSRVAAQVDTVERHASLAEAAKELLTKLGYANVRVHHGDGSLGWSGDAPYDAIVVTAASPSVPNPLIEQLREGGRLIIPIGSEDEQELVRLTRTEDGSLHRENLGDVRFVPLIGKAGWEAKKGVLRPAHERSSRTQTVARLVKESCETITDFGDTRLEGLLDRIGDAKIVLLGEATHGTSEFYRMRAQITHALILRRGFNLVAVEADWPDAARIDRYICHLPPAKSSWTPFSRFPKWMWRNHEVLELVEWLRARNREFRDVEQQVHFCGVDLYSLFTSAAEVISYLKRVDPESAAVAQRRYGCLTPWESSPQAYGRAVVQGNFVGCEANVVRMLTDLLKKRLEYAQNDGDRFVDAFQNARVVVDAERYYRTMYYGSVDSWNLRDEHMFETLVIMMATRPNTKAVVWAHNSHLGDAAATEMGARGELNVGQLARKKFGDAAYLVGFGTDHGTVAASTEWEGPMEIKRVRPSHSMSYERIMHESGVPAFMLPLRYARRSSVREELMEERLERAIGVIYRPETELQSHYFQARLPAQFDEFVWFDETNAVRPLLEAAATMGVPETYPFGL